MLRFYAQVFEKGHKFEFGFAAFSYEIVRNSIKRFKFDGIKSYGTGLGELMVWYAMDCHKSDMDAVDVFIPVPMFLRKQKGKGI